MGRGSLMSEPDSYDQARVLQELSDGLKATRSDSPAPAEEQGPTTSAPEHEAQGDARQVVTANPAPDEGSPAPTTTKRSPARQSGATKVPTTQETPADPA